MGLRDHKPSVLRTTSLKPTNSDEGRELLRIVGRGVAGNWAKIVAMARGVALPRLDAMIDTDREEGRSAFAETALGGVAISVGILVGFVALLWVGSLL